MISFDCFTLSELIKELKCIIEGARVHKVQQTSKHELILTLRTQGKNRKLCISAHPRFSYIALLDQSNRSYAVPQKPPMFCMLLRKHMEGAKIINLNQPDNERILEIEFESFNELGDREKMTLACEIMGKYSNIVLYISSTKLILGCAHNVGELMSSQRELAGGLKYVLPPAQAKVSILNMSVEDFILQTTALNRTIDVWLSETFYNISLAMAKEFCNYSGIKISRGESNLNKRENLVALYSSIVDFLNQRNFRPSISVDNSKYSLIGIDPFEKYRKVDSVNEMVDSYFAYHIEKDKVKRLQDSLRARVNKEIKKISKKLQKIQNTILKAHNAEEYRVYADLLMVNLYKEATRADKITLDNIYDDNKKVEIVLDPSLNLNQNAQKYYKQYNKIKSSLDIQLKFKIKEQAELKYFQGLLISIMQGDNCQVLQEIIQELDIQLNRYKVTNVKQKEKKQLPKYMRFLTDDGFEILVGRNNNQNDYLISKVAHFKDMWVHVQNAHGSHVIITTDRGSKEIPENTLHNAALLAGYYSEGRFSSSVPIIYTLKKNIKKPSNAKPGYVTYSGEKTIYVNPLEEHVFPILKKEIK